MKTLPDTLFRKSQQHCRISGRNQSHRFPSIKERTGSNPGCGGLKQERTKPSLLLKARLGGGDPTGSVVTPWSLSAQSFRTLECQTFPLQFSPTLLQLSTSFIFAYFCKNKMTKLAKFRFHGLPLCKTFFKLV